jgi:hypothetical protein
MISIYVILHLTSDILCLTSSMTDTANMATENQCSIEYSPFIKCGNALHTVYDGKGVCKYHFYNIKVNDDCPICLMTMDDCRVKLMLSCRHYFHQECLSMCHDSRCPLCRKQMTPREGRRIFLPTVWRPIIENVYKLPITSVVSSIDTIKKVVRVCEQGEWFAEQINDFCNYFVKACDVSDEIRDIQRNNDGIEHTYEEHHTVIDDLVSNMVDIMTGVGGDDERVA